MTTRFKAILLICVFAGLAACAYQPSDNPVVRKFGWFSYLDGADIRAACRPGAGDHYRMIYNGVYTEQVRTYELTPSTEPGKYDLRIEVTNDANLTEFEIDLKRPDLLKPWRPKVSSTQIPARDADTFRRALRSDGVFAPPPDINMPSINFYWIVAACHEGAFKFNGFMWPSARFNSLAFPKLLAAWDFSGVPINPPRRTTVDEFKVVDQDENLGTLFQVRLGPNGLNRSLF